MGFSRHDVVSALDAMSCGVCLPLPAVLHLRALRARRALEIDGMDLG